MNGFFQHRHDGLHRFAAIVGVLLVLMLDVLAASPILHEKVCHHADHACRGDCDGGSSHEHDCAACVVTHFAAGHGIIPVPVFVGPRFARFERVLPLVSERQAPRCFKLRLWPESNAPPIAA
ncbi:MAG: hypothetical protein JW942_10345 [Opitutales bacterium]|nr:hypothetical protein [Opitutales bacterium]